MKDANTKERGVISSEEQMNSFSCLYQQKTLKSLPVRSLSLNKHKHQEKMPFRDKNQTVQINVKLARGNDVAQDQSMQKVLSQY